MAACAVCAPDDDDGLAIVALALVTLAPSSRGTALHCTAAVSARTCTCTCMRIPSSTAVDLEPELSRYPASSLAFYGLTSTTGIADPDLCCSYQGRC